MYTQYKWLLLTMSSTWMRPLSLYARSWGRQTCALDVFAHWIVYMNILGSVGTIDFENFWGRCILPVRVLLGHRGSLQTTAPGCMKMNLHNATLNLQKHWGLSGNCASWVQKQLLGLYVCIARSGSERDCPCTHCHWPQAKTSLLC